MLGQLTLRDLYSQLDEELQINSDDSVFDYRYYYDIIKQVREIDIRNEYNRNRSINEAVIQVLPCVEMIVVDATTCPCGDFPTDCKILRSKYKMPTAIEFYQSDGFLTFKPNKVLSKTFTYVKADRIPYITNDEVGKNTVYVFLWDGYLYAYSFNDKYLLIEAITIRVIAVDPLAASEIGCKENEKCMTEDDPFPIASWMWQSTTKPKVLQILMAKQFMPRDENNNAKDDKSDISLGKNTKNKE